mgnify:CR=1 FL=1
MDKAEIPVQTLILSGIVEVPRYNFVQVIAHDRPLGGIVGANHRCDDLQQQIQHLNVNRHQVGEKEHRQRLGRDHWRYKL